MTKWSERSGSLTTEDDLALWALRRLPAKNTLTAGDASAVEFAYQAALDVLVARPEGAAPLPELDVPANGPRSSRDRRTATIPQPLGPFRRSVKRAVDATRPISPLSARSLVSSASAALATPIT